MRDMSTFFFLFENFSLLWHVTQLIKRYVSSKILISNCTSLFLSLLLCVYSSFVLHNKSTECATNSHKKGELNLFRMNWRNPKKDGFKNIFYFFYLLHSQFFRWSENWYWLLGFLAHRIQGDNTTQRTFLFSNNRARAAWALSDEWCPL